MDSKWQLGVDLDNDDNLLDGITFEQLILMLQCNEKYINKRTVQKVIKEIMEQRLEDMKELLVINLDEIILRASEGRA